MLVCATNPTVYIAISIAAVLLTIIVALLLFVFTRGQNTAKKAEKTEKNTAVFKGKESRFPTLSRLDTQRFTKTEGENITLEKLCESFRDFAASKLKLYYDIEDIRRFISGFAVSKIIILQGISGTGKTSLAYAFGEFISSPTTVIPVQPMWKERTDLIGYYNEFTARFNETTLLSKLYQAGLSDEIFITLLDEMNIARIEYYFAEFLSLLELPDPKRRFLDVVSDRWDNDPKQLKNGQIILPDNMWFVGTANNDDSTFLISDKVYDRAMILNLDFKAQPFCPPETDPISISFLDFNTLVDCALNEYEISRRNMRRLHQLDEYLIANFHITFGNRINHQIQRFVPIYMACGGDEIAALDDILAKKVIRKLQMQNSVYLKNAAEPFCNKLDELFGADSMKVCKDYIAQLVRNG